MRALRELTGVVVAGALAFFGGIALVLGFFALWLCGTASALCLMVSGFAGVMYWVTGKPHDGQIALTYFGYAAIPFVLTFMAGFYRRKVGRPSNRTVARRKTLAA
jgi:hypothetical protein